MFTSPHQFIPKGHICRDSVNECDLHEYCNGSSAACQEDLHIQDGHPCGQNQWLCVSGICVDGIKQCLDIFGEGIYFNLIACICIFLETNIHIFICIH